ncbi:MAG TPA: EAL domain-containing protein [Gemmatirosa sp.]
MPYRSLDVSPNASEAALLYRALLDSHPEPTFTLDRSGVIRECNRAFAHFVGRPGAALVGESLASLVLPGHRPAAEQAWALASLGRAQSWQAEFVGPDETVSIAYVTLVPVIVDRDVVGLQGIARDVTVYQVIEEQLQARVFTDPLTGLASRTQLLEGASRACRRAERPASVAMLFLDLDDFKLVNDGLGHAIGDQVLAAVAGRLRRATRGADLPARLGGDEFAVLLDALAVPEDASVVVERIFAALGEPLLVDGRSIATVASIGVAHWDGTATPAELLRNADLAMYRAKTLGKGRHAVYDAGMQAAARERLELASDLRAALRGDEAAGGVLHAAYQPIVDAARGVPVKVEALARWTHPTRGPVPPGVFIPVAEETGLVEELGTFMLRAGCRQLRAWADAARATGAAPIGMTVNVSGRQIERGTLVATVRDVLAETGADPAGLTLELTESVAMRDPQRVLATLNALTSLGVKLAIDDFGTGYSSLSYLQRFPLDALKIDKSFVDGLALGGAAGAQAAGLVRAVVQMAAALGLQTVAEGVETAAQHDVLRALGCDLAQGYHFGRPGTAAAVDALAEATSATIA